MVIIHTYVKLKCKLFGHASYFMANKIKICGFGIAQQNYLRLVYGMDVRIYLMTKQCDVVRLMYDPWTNVCVLSGK